MGPWKSIIVESIPDNALEALGKYIECIEIAQIGVDFEQSGE